MSVLESPTEWLAPLRTPTRRRSPDPAQNQPRGRAGGVRVVGGGDDEVEAAMGALFADAHNTAEGGGGAALAALLQEKERMRDKKTAVIISGGNVDTPPFSRVLSVV